MAFKSFKNPAKMTAKIFYRVKFGKIIAGFVLKFGRFVSGKTPWQFMGRNL
jgi:hypothetical protein